jgi:8-oxo-dGTP diphosphatase
MGPECQRRTKMQYVLGFMFSEDRSKVALIRKDRPAWQRGKLNAPGGKIEPGEAPLDTMVREFCEETGCQTEPGCWSLFARIEGKGENEEPYEVYCFVAVGDLRSIRRTEDEVPCIVEVDKVSVQRDQMVGNLAWLVHMALDHLADGGPRFAIITYP